MADAPIKQWRIRNAWINFVKNVQTLLVPQPENRPLDQYLAFRDEVLTVVESEQFLTGLDEAWPVFTDEPKTEVGKGLLVELEAFPRAVEVAKAIQRPDESKAWWRTLLGQASTISGSVKDIMDNLPPAAKSGIILFGELIDLFRGKE